MQCNFPVNIPAPVSKLLEDESCEEKIVKKIKPNTPGTINKTVDNQGGGPKKKVDDISSIVCSNPQEIDEEQWKYFIAKVNKDDSLKERTFGDCGGKISVYNPTGKNPTFLHFDHGEIYDLVKDKSWHPPGKYDYSEIKTWQTGPEDINKE
jgi:hypothetical protein